MQHSSTILLVRPRHFGYNAETAVNNTFQAAPDATRAAVSRQAVEEFKEFEQRLRSRGVNVLVFDDTTLPVKPDAVFPNNWVSFHPDGTVVLYPMFAPSRRNERRPDIIEKLRERFTVKKVVDLSHYEKENRFLEGTGSIVFDHVNRLAFACRSPRTDGYLLDEACRLLGYRKVVFDANDHGGMAIYHTNVMMCIAEHFAVICLESITDKKERDVVTAELREGGHEIIGISLSQLNHFAGNMLAVKGSQGCVLVMSQSAFDSLTSPQKEHLARHCELLPVPIRTIETIGGGSARCMMAEVFLPQRR